MIAIQTKYLGATNTKGARIKAWTCNGQSITVSMDYEYSGAEAFWPAAKALIKKYNWTGDYVAAGTDVGYVFVNKSGLSYQVS